MCPALLAVKVSPFGSTQAPHDSINVNVILVNYPGEIPFLINCRVASEN